jgi:hypothetical protein
VEVADLITLPRAVVQQALAFTMRDFATVRDFEAARAALHDTLKAALEQPEPDATEQALAHAEAFSRGHDAGWQSAIAHRAALEQPEQEEYTLVAWFNGKPVYSAPPRCPNCASLEAQNTELDRKLAALEQPERAQKMRDAGYTRRPTLREMAEPVGVTMNTTKHENHGAVAGQVDCRVRPAVAVAHGSDEHLTLLGAPWHWNLLHGVDRADMLAYGRACMEAERKRIADECNEAALEQQEQGGKTGWPPVLLQDDCRGLSKWLASQPDARRRVREAVAALEQPEQADGMPASADERYLRRLLAARVGIPGAYYDDGEAQGAQHGISIDFMREPVADIDAKLRALNAARAKVTQPERLEWEFFGCMKIRPDMGADIFFARSLTLEPGVEFALCMAKPKGVDA